MVGQGGGEKTILTEASRALSGAVYFTRSHQTFCQYVTKVTQNSYNSINVTENNSQNFCNLCNKKTDNAREVQSLNVDSKYMIAWQEYDLKIYKCSHFSWNTDTQTNKQTNANNCNKQIYAINNATIFT